MSSSSVSAPELGPFQFLVLVLSVFVLVVLGVELVFDLSPELSRVISWIDDAVCVVLLADFVVRYRRAESKREFMKWGWIDLLASIPEIEMFRAGRVFRVFRVLRLVRAVRSIRHLVRLMFESRVQGGMVSLSMITFMVLASASVAILVAERSPDANIRTAGDAVWWSVTTITTVGYGDRYPVTTAGRVVAVILMFSGAGLFGTLSGVLASFFLGQRDDARGDEERRVLRAENARLRAEIAASRTPSKAVGARDVP